VQASDVYSLGMIIWEVLTLSPPPTASLAAYVASGHEAAAAAAAHPSGRAPGPCDASLAELLSLDEAGDAATLVRKCHGVACPVLAPLAAIVRAAHRHAPAERPTAAQLAAELCALEERCRGLPPARVPSTGEHMAAYWRSEGDGAGGGGLGDTSLESFRTFSDEASGDVGVAGELQWDGADEESKGAAWTRAILRTESD
jgi:hypothetical protein